MMKKTISWLLAVALFLTLTAFACPTAMAAESDETLVYDDADLLTNKEEKALQEKLADISGEYDAQVIVVTTETSEGLDVPYYAEIIYDSMEFGYGEDRDGVMLFVCMDPRECQIIGNGFAAEAIDDSTIEVILDAFVPYLSDGEYAEAFDIFADRCRFYLDGHINGFPFDVGASLVFALVVGLIIGLIVTGVWKSQLKSVRRQNEANVYIKPGSMHLTQAGDYYMYRNIVRTARPKNTSSSGSSGSSRSSGGRSF